MPPKLADVTESFSISVSLLSFDPEAFDPDCEGVRSRFLSPFTCPFPLIVWEDNLAKI